jgi:enamine deaminase RidA (YjgF/YER057c/UK114 family)
VPPRKAQLQLAVDALARALADHGRSPDEVGRDTVYLADHALRARSRPEAAVPGPT